MPHREDGQFTGSDLLIDWLADDEDVADDLIGTRNTNTRMYTIVLALGLLTVVAFWLLLLLL